MLTSVDMTYLLEKELSLGVSKNVALWVKLPFHIWLLDWVPTNPISTPLPADVPWEVREVIWYGTPVA